jgi:hypothetical protein
MDASGATTSYSGPDGLHVCFESGYSLGRFGPLSFCGGSIDWSALIYDGGTPVGLCAIGGGTNIASYRILNEVVANNRRVFKAGCAIGAGTAAGIGFEAVLKQLANLAPAVTQSTGR